MNETAFSPWRESLFWNNPPFPPYLLIISWGKKWNSSCGNIDRAVSCSKKIASGKGLVNGYETAKWILTCCRVTPLHVSADKLWKATKYSFSCPKSRWSQITPNSRHCNEPLLPTSTLLTFFTKQLFPSDVASSRTQISKDWILLQLGWPSGSGLRVKISHVIVEIHTSLHVENNTLKFRPMMTYKLDVKYRKKHTERLCG